MFTPAEGLELTPQQARVINYLKTGSTLTASVALNNLAVGSLTSRIAELRKLGFTITKRMDKGFDGRAFKKYDLDQEAPQPEFTIKGE